MIRCQELVPDYYIEESRDFQVLCRLYDYTRNALKFNIDTMQSLTNTKLVKDTVLPLVGDKFGIYDKNSYTNRELLTALPSAVKNKGSLSSVKILLNAYLDSLNIFDYAVAYHSKDEESAEEISSILNRDIKPYTIVIVLSTSPSLVDLHVLDEFMKMVIPCGMIVEYVFGISKTIFDKFKYLENVFMYFVKGDEQSTVKSKSSKYYIINEYTGETPQDKFIQKVTSDIDVPSVGLAHVSSGEKQPSDTIGSTPVRVLETYVVNDVQQHTVNEIEN